MSKILANGFAASAFSKRCRMCYTCNMGMNGIDGAGRSWIAGRRASTTIKRRKHYKCQQHWPRFQLRFCQRCSGSCGSLVEALGSA